MSGAVLLVDVGNSRLKWARVAEDGHWSHGVPFSTRSADFDRHWAEVPRPDAVWVSNVAGPDAADRLQHWVERQWGRPVQFGRSQVRCGAVVNGYARPEQLGVDRWFGLLGLYRPDGRPACLVDCGTAITVDVLDADGRHQGGLIAPGLETMAAALRQRAPGLASATPTPPVPPTLGRDTASGVGSGCLLAAAGLIEKVFQDTAAGQGALPRLVLTGGDAAAIGACLSQPHALDESIVLRGLLIGAGLTS